MADIIDMTTRETEIEMMAVSATQDIERMTQLVTANPQHYRQYALMLMSSATALICAAGALLVTQETQH